MNICSICFEKARHKLICNHIVHKKCILEYAKQKADHLFELGYPIKRYISCPICIKDTNIQMPIYKEITIDNYTIQALYENIESLCLKFVLENLLPEWTTKKEFKEYANIIKMQVWTHKNLEEIIISRTNKGFKTRLLYKI